MVIIQQENHIKIIGITLIFCKKITDLLFYNRFQT